MYAHSLSKKAQSHDRIVQAASRELRRAGFAGVGIAEVMKEAGLTHGGFYSHFASRNALLVEAMLFASADIGSRIREHVKTLTQGGKSTFAAFVETYLHDSQISDCANGCPVAALCSEMHSSEEDVRSASQQIVGNLHVLVKEAMPATTCDSEVWGVAGALIGAMQLARSVGDTQKGRDILAAARADLILRHDK